MVRCNAKTLKGTKCKNTRINGFTKCSTHQLSSSRSFNQARISARGKRASSRQGISGDGRPFMMRLSKLSTNYRFGFRYKDMSTGDVYRVKPYGFKQLNKVTEKPTKSFIRSSRSKRF